MDELKFLQELSDLSRRIPSGAGDIRSAVWERIENSGSPTENAPFAAAEERKFEFGLNIAAVMILVISVGLLHSTLSSLMSEVFWRSALCTLYSYF